MEVRFLVDTMCGRLSRWLRILGYDTVWLTDKERKFLVVRCLKESRILVTRDGRFQKTRGIKKILLRDDALAGQIRQIVNELHLELNESNFFRLCTFCNQVLEPVEKNTIFSRVPPYVYQSHQRFYQCHLCRRTFWEGTHKKLFSDQIKEILPDLPLNPH